MADFYINAKDAATGLPKLFAPEWIQGAGGISWKSQQQGGLASIDVSLAVPFESLPLKPGDLIEVIAAGEFDALGRPLPRARGILTLPEQDADTTETYKLTCTGLMAALDKIVIQQVFIDPVGSDQDLNWYAAQVVTAADHLLPGILTPLTRDLQATGITLETLDCSGGSTVRGAMDTLYSQGAGELTWGFDISPLDGTNRIYLRPRAQVISHQFFVGGSVQHLAYPAELDLLVNGVLLKGGPAKFPNLVTNASFESPTNPSSDTGDLLVNGGFETPYNGTNGGDTTLTPWVGSGSVTRNTNDPSTNHNGSAHSGKWYILLDSTGKSLYQDVDISGYAVGASFVAFLFARNENARHLATGTMAITGVNGSGTQTESGVFLPIAPQSVTWTGGAASSIAGQDALQISFTKTSASSTKARIKLSCTSTTGAGFGLLLDDVVFAPVGAVGQTGWGTHLRNPGSSANVFNSILWGCQAANWDGAFGVRANVTCSVGNECYINPAGPDLDPNSQFHFTPTPQANYYAGVYLRMSPGVAGGAGLARMEYREWASDGHEDNYQASANTTIPNDGLWHLVYVGVSSHGDAKTASAQLALCGSGVYDVDGFFVRDQSVALPATTANMQTPELANYQRGADFEKWVYAENVCPATGGTPQDTTANASASVWTRKTIILDNKQITDWTASAQAIMQAFFRKAANLLHRHKVVLIDEGAAIVLPGDTGQVQVSGFSASADPSPAWVSAADYSYKDGLLTTTLDLSDERPSIAKLLLGIAQAAVGSSGGGGSSSGIGAGGSGGGGSVTTPKAGLVMQIDLLSPTGSSGAFTLSQIPASSVLLYDVSRGGLKIAQSYITSVTGTALLLSYSPDAGLNSIEAVYWYAPTTS